MDIRQKQMLRRLIDDAVALADTKFPASVTDVLGDVVSMLEEVLYGDEEYGEGDDVEYGGSNSPTDEADDDA